MKPVLLLPLLALLVLGACRAENVSKPEPVVLTAEAAGHFCQMNLMEHPGPKAQVHLKDMPNPLFFSQVRDAVAYKLMPEQDGQITAIYVNDMGAAPSWEQPGTTNWIDADAAFYVTGSARQGGMGAPELIPFAADSAARAFAQANGGTVQRLNEIAPETVLTADGAAAPEEDADFLARLQVLAADRKQENM